ncbi:MAG: hypothetical protein ACJ8AB_05175 [Gemmatimonadaceae bacterium]
MPGDLGAIIALTGVLTGVGILVAAFAGAYFIGKSRAHQEVIRSGTDPDLAQRIARIEQIVEATAIEIERISEGQRFTTRLLSDKKSVES